jgi:hypothetical protein
VKIAQKFKQQNKQEFGSANPQQAKYGKDNPNSQNSQDNQSKPQEKKGNEKTKKDTRKWSDFHKISSHNTNGCRSKQSLVTKLKEIELSSESDSDLDNNKMRQIIDAKPTAIVTTTTIQLEEPEDHEEGEHLFHSQTWVKGTTLHFIVEEGECLFHSQMWVKGTPLHFIVDSRSYKNLISTEVFKQLDLSTTPHPHPYNTGWLRQG